MKTIYLSRPNELGYYIPSLENGTTRITFTKSQFSPWIAGQTTYMLQGYWELTKSSGYSLDVLMYNIWLDCDNGAAYWNRNTQQIEELELSTAADIRSKRIIGNSLNPSFRILYKVNSSGLERPVIVNSGDQNDLIRHWRDQAQGKPITYIELEVGQWSIIRPKLLDTSNLSLEYTDGRSDGIYEIPWAIPAGRDRVVILRIMSTTTGEFYGPHDLVYGKDSEIAAYMSNRANDSNKIGKITPAFTGYGYFLNIVHADPSAAKYRIKLDEAYYKLVSGFDTKLEDEILGIRDDFVAA